MLAAAANTKNEGLAVAGALLLVATALWLLYRLRVRHLLLASGAVVLASMPWRIWVAAHGIKGDLQFPNALEPGYLLDRFGRVQPTLEALSHQLAAQGSWVYMLPLAFLVIVACLWSGVCRKVAVFYLASFVLVCVVYIWVYWSSLFEINWYLRFSAERVVDGLVFICAMAVLHLSGILAAHRAPSQAEASPDPPISDLRKPAGNVLLGLENAVCRPIRNDPGGHPEGEDTNDAPNRRSQGGRRGARLPRRRLSVGRAGRPARAHRGALGGDGADPRAPLAPTTPASSCATSPSRSPTAAITSQTSACCAARRRCSGRWPRRRRPTG